MITTTLFTVAPLILAALPAAAVPQHLWKDDTYCLEATTETVTLTQTAADDPASSSTDPDEPQVTGFIETTTETMTLTSTLTVVPTVDAEPLESADPIMSPETKVAASPEAETVTLFNTVTEVSTSISTVTVEIPQPTVFPFPTSDLDLPTSTGSAVPLPLNLQPYYVNSTVGPYGNSSLAFNASAPVIPAFNASAPLIPAFNASAPLIPVFNVSAPVVPFFNISAPVLPDFNLSAPVIPVFNVSTPTNPLFNLSGPVVSAPPLAAPSPSSITYSGYENGIYFTNWGIYAADYQPQSLPASQITRVIYAFADIDINGTVFSSDPYADVENHYDSDPYDEPGNNAYGCVKQLYLLKKQNRQLNVLLSIGGWTYSEQFPDVAANPVARQRFADSAVKLVTDWGFDGVEIDWEYPSDAIQAANLVSLLQVLRYELDNWAAVHAPGHKLIITIASPASGGSYSIMDLKGMDPYVDSWNLMAYDYAGSWDNTTGHQANIYFNPKNQEATKFSTEQAVSDYIARGILPSKIVLGMPTFGRTFETTAGLGLPFKGVGSGSPRLDQAGLWLYRELPRVGATEIYDDTAKASYSYDNVTHELISYDNVHAVNEKKSYVFSRGLGGVVFWEASGDRNGSDSLVSTLAFALGVLNNKTNLLNYSTSQYDNIRNGMAALAV